MSLGKSKDTGEKIFIPTTPLGTIGNIFHGDTLVAINAPKPTESKSNQQKPALIT